MSRMLRKHALCLALATTLMVVAAGWLLLWTETGAVWLLGQIASRVGGSLSVASVRGKIAGSLTLEGLNLETSSFRLQVDELDVRARITSLLSRHLELLEVDATGIDFHLAESRPGGDQTDWYLPWRLTVHSFEGHEIRFFAPNESRPLALDSLNVDGWANGYQVEIDRISALAATSMLNLKGRLNLQERGEIELRTEWTRTQGDQSFRVQGQVGGNRELLHFRQNLLTPYLASAEVTVHDPFGKARVEGMAKLPAIPFPTDEPHAGQASLDLEFDGPLDEIACKGRISVQAKGLAPFLIDSIATIHPRSDIRLDRILLSGSGFTGQLEGEGSFSWGQSERFDLVLQWADLAGNEQGVWGQLGSREGELRIGGSMALWEASLNGELSARGYPDGHLSLIAKGGPEEMTLPLIDGHILGGTIEGSGELSLVGGGVWRTSLRARNIDPSGIWPEWPGKLFFAVEGGGLAQRGGEAVAELVLDKLAGQLRNLPVAGRSRLEVSKGGVSAEALELTWGNLSLAGAARLDGPWSLRWKIDAPELQEYLPGFEGALLGRGSLAGETQSTLRLVADLEAQNLRWRDHEAKAFTLAADGSLESTRPWALNIEARDLVVGGQQLGRLEVRGQGLISSHQASVTTELQGRKSTLGIKGAFDPDRGAWTGTLENIQIDTSEAGQWRQIDVAHATISDGSAYLTGLCLSSGLARLCGDLSGGSGGFASAEVNLSSVPLELVESAMPPWIRLRGEVGGDLKLAWREDSLPGVGGRLNLSNGEVQLAFEGMPDVSIPIRHAALVAHTSIAEPRIELTADMAGAGDLRADFTVRSPESSPDGRALEGLVRLTLVDLGFLSPLALPDWSPSGRVDLEVRASGRMEEPTWTAGGSLTDVDLLPFIADPRAQQLSAHFDGRFQAEHSSLAGLAVSGELSAREGAHWNPWTDEREPFAISSAHLRFAMDAEEAWGGFEAMLGDVGILEALVSLPAPRFPLSSSPAQEIRGWIRASVPDVSLLASPSTGNSLVAGRLEAEYELGGSLERPAVDGRANLTNGHLSLVELGAELTQVTAEVVGDPRGTLEVHASARSGEGQLTLEGSIPIHPSELEPGRFRVLGNDIRLWDRPGFDVHASPDLQIGLFGGRLEVGGTVKIDRAKIEWEKVDSAIRPSRDVVLVHEGQVERAPTMTNRSEFVLVLGDSVSFEGEGIRSRITGSVSIVDQSGAAPQARGSLRLEEGRYSIYGRELRIDRGDLLFLGGPLDDPMLDVSASRKSRDGAIAGIRVGGSLKGPKLSLWSDLPISDKEILSYLVFGRPIDETDTVDKKALGEAAISLGLDTFGKLTSGLGAKTQIVDLSVEAKDGYESAAVFLGRDLSSRVYMSYGVGILSGLQTFRLRFLLGNGWLLQGESGQEVGGDLIYRMDRDREGPGSQSASDMTGFNRGPGDSR